MLYVVVLRYIRPLEDVDAHMAAHRDYLYRGYAAGRFLASGPQEPRQGGILLARAPSRDTLLDWLAEDPFHQAGVAAFEVLAFQPTLRASELPVDLAPDSVALPRLGA